MSQGLRMASDARPYQGYPYVNPTYTSVGDISLSERPAASPTNESMSQGLRMASDARPYQGYPYVNPTYTSVGDISLSDRLAASPTNESMSQSLRSTEQTRYQGYPYVNPPVVDVSSLNAEELAALARWQHLPRRQLGGKDGRAGLDAASRPSGSKDDLDERPVVYIDIPEANGSEVSQTMDDNRPDFTQETIFYDPFKDRRIDVRDTDSEGEAPSEATAGSSRPPPPGSLTFSGAGSSTYSSPGSNPIPPYMRKEAHIYQPDDGFPLSPLPVSDFPEPPPSYDDVPVLRPVTSPVAPEEPPRTQVITPTSPTIVLDGSRKLITCRYCRATVQTIVVTELGFWTHVLAVLFFFIFMPMVIIVYCCDCAKYRNHYCPQCNKEVASESPMLCCRAEDS